MKNFFRINETAHFPSLQVASNEQTVLRRRINRIKSNSIYANLEKSDLDRKSS